MNDRMALAINKQINEELYSAYLYHAIRAYFDNLGFDGFSSWMDAQTKEEVFHAEKFFSYMAERGGKVKLYAIKEPDCEWNSPLEAFSAALEHEKHITKCINDLVDIAVEEKDYATRNLLNWYIDEQVEEEDNVGKVVNKLRLIKEDGRGLLMLDRELAVRTFTPDPSTE